MSTQDTETDFDFYLRFAKPLVLNLNKPNDRALAAAWVQKLRDKKVGTEKLRTDYLKLLLFVLQRKQLIGVFSKNPNQFEKLEEFPETNLHNVAKELLEVEEQYRKQEIVSGVSGAKGDSPPYSTEHSADLLEYSAAQDIPNFGVHAYYAISNEPLPNWDRTDKAIFPRATGTATTPERSTTRLDHTINNISSDGRIEHYELENLPSKSKSDHKNKRPKSKSKSRSRSTSKSKHKSCPDLVDQYEKMDLKSTILTIEASETASNKKKGLVKDTPSPPMGSKASKRESRDPPTWGSNLIRVTEPPVREITAEPILSEEADPLMLTSEASMFGAESISSDYANTLYFPSSTKQGGSAPNTNLLSQHSPHHTVKLPQGERNPFFLETAMLSSSSSSKSSYRNISLKRAGPALSGDDWDDGNEGREWTSKESAQNGYDRLTSEYEREEAPAPPRQPTQRRPVASTSQGIPPCCQQTYQRLDPRLQQPSTSTRTLIPPSQVRTSGLRLPTAKPSCCRGGPQIAMQARPGPSQVARTAVLGYPRNPAGLYRSAVPQVPALGGSRIPSYPRPSGSRIAGPYRSTSDTRIPIPPTLTTSGTRIPGPCTSRSRIPVTFTSGVLASRGTTSSSRISAPCRTTSSNRIPAPCRTISGSRIPATTREGSRLPRRRPVLPTVPPPYTSPPFPQEEADPFFLESPPSFLAQTSFSSYESPVRRSPAPPIRKSPQQAGLIGSAPALPYTSPPFPQGEADPFFLESPPSFLAQTSFSSYKSPVRPSPVSPAPTRSRERSPQQAKSVSPAGFFVQTSSPSVSRPCPVSPKKPCEPCSSISIAPQQTYDPNELINLGLRPEDLDEAVFNLDDIEDLEASRMTVPSDTEYELSQYKPEDSYMDKELDELDRQIAALEAEHAEDIALFGSPQQTVCPQTCTRPPKKSSKSKTKPPPVIASTIPAVQDIVDAANMHREQIRQQQILRHSPPRAPEDEKAKLVSKTKTKIMSVRPVSGITTSRSIQTTRKIEHETKHTERSPIKPADQSSDWFEECERECGVTTEPTVLPPPKVKEYDIKTAHATAHRQYQELLNETMADEGYQQRPADTSFDSFEECERVCGITPADRTGPTVPPKEIEHSIQAAQAAANKQYKELLRHAALAEEYERYKQRYKYRKQGMPKTPPVFSKFAPLMGPEAEKEYHPSEFGITDNVQWVPAEQYFEGKTQFSPRVCERGGDLKQLLPGIQRQVEAEQFFQTEAEPEYLVGIDKEIEELAAAEEAQKQITPTKGGIPVTTPRRSPDPRRPAGKARMDQSHLHFESPPLEFYGSPCESPLSPEAAQALPAPYGLPKRVLFPPVTPVDLSIHMQSNLREVQAKAQRQLQLLDSPKQLDAREEEDINVYIRPERRELIRRVAHLVSDTPDTFVGRHKFREWNLPPVTETRGVLEETPPRHPPSPPPISPICSPVCSSKSPTPRKSPSPARSASPARTASPARSTSPAKTPPSRRSPSPDEHFPLYGIVEPQYLSEELPPEDFYPSPHTPPAQQPSPSLERPSESPACLICKLYEAGEPVYNRQQAMTPQGVCEHQTLMEQPPRRYVTSRRMKIAKPQMEPVRESPIRVPQFTYQHLSTGKKRTAEELKQQYRDLPALPLPEDLLGMAAPADWQQSPCGKCELDKSLPEDLPSPMKPPTVIPGWLTPPRLRTPAPPPRAKLPGPAEQFIVSPVPRQDIAHEIPPADLMHSPPQLSPGESNQHYGLQFSPRSARILTSSSPRVQYSASSSHEGAAILEQEEEPVFYSPVHRIPPPSPESPVESPYSLFMRLYTAQEPPYYSQDQMNIYTGGTRSRVKRVKKRVGLPTLYSLREMPEAYHEEHLPFLSQVEAAQPFPRSNRRMNVAVPSMHTVEESPLSKKIKTKTSRRKVGVDKSDPNNPVVTEVVETEETIEDAEPPVSASLKDILKNLDRRYADLPELPQAPPPEDLMGVAGSTHYHTQLPPGILDRSIPEGLPSPIRPPTVIPGWSTPPRLRTPVPPHPQYKFKLHPNLRDILFQEMPPPGLNYSPTSPPCASPCLAGTSPSKQPQQLTTEIPSSDQKDLQTSTKSSPQTPIQDVFQKEPQFLVVEMPPEEFMPPGSPPSPETMEKHTRFTEAPMSPDTTVDSFEQHEKSAEESPTANIPVSSLPKAELSPSSQLRETRQKIEQQYKSLTQEAPCARSPQGAPCSIPQEFLDRSLREFEAMEQAVCSGTPSRTGMNAPARAVFDHIMDAASTAQRQYAELYQSPNRSLEEYEALEQAICQGTPVRTNASAPCRAVFDQMMNTATKAQQQYAEMQRSPTWLERVEQKIRDVPDPHLPMQRTIRSPEYGVAVPEWSPKLPKLPQYTEQIEDEFVPEGVWGYASPKTPTMSPQSPRSCMATCGSPQADIFDVEPVPAEFLDSILQPELPGSPEDKIPTPPRIDEYYRVHSPPPPDSPAQLAEAVQGHVFTEHFYDREKRLLTPYVQVKSRRVPTRGIPQPQFSPIKESFIEDSPKPLQRVPTTEVIEEIIEEIIEDVDGVGSEVDESGLNFITPPKQHTAAVPPPRPFVYVPGPRYKDELAFQSPPQFYQSPKADIFEETGGSNVFDVTPPLGWGLSPPHFSPEDSPYSPYFSFTPPQVSVHEPPCSPSPDFKQSLKEHEYTLERGTRWAPYQRTVQSPPLERIQEHYFELPDYPKVGYYMRDRPVVREHTQVVSPPRQQRSPNYELPRAVYYGSPGREYIRTPISKVRPRHSPPRDNVEQKAVTIAETREPWDDGSPCNVCPSTRLPFADQTCPAIMDTSLIPSDLDTSYMEEDQADFRWMG
ncbi:hypothetical protein ILUMI_00969 [Ignelater luminosus]|uniref:DUF4485 domain-containing protein n=1 Tax=Ignelater luminosus TaxID=2038154 RepID=A0A8K0DKK1_IGNLU|nr:hypothetical protein ILUMI_00969 [Ignelater luminosus]